MPPPRGQLRSRILMALVAGALVLGACGGDDDDDAQDPAAVKTCLDEAGFDTSEPTGLESAFFEGEAIEYRDEFAAIQGESGFLLWFLNDEEDARGLAEVVKQFGDEEPPEGQPRVEGTAVLAYDPEQVDADAIETVEGCLGL